MMTSDKSTTEGIKRTRQALNYTHIHIRDGDFYTDGSQKRVLKGWGMPVMVIMKIFDLKQLQKLILTNKKNDMKICLSKYENII